MDELSIKEISLPLHSSKGWLKFIGVMLIIMGVLTALSIVGILIAWLPIWMGVLLFQSAGAIEQAYTSSDKASLLKSLNKLKTYFVIMGIVLLIYLIIMALALFMGIGGVFMLGAA